MFSKVKQSLDKSLTIVFYQYTITKNFIHLRLIITSTAYSQTAEDTEKMYNNNELDKKPKFRGDMEKFYKFVGSYNPLIKKTQCIQKSMFLLLLFYSH